MSRSVVVIATLTLSLCEHSGANAEECRALRYSFQVASRPPASVPPGALELPPQIAVWLETGNGSFVDTVMVTTGVALRGIGNRPGQAELPSGPKFPYGRRPMALPVWAHARGRLYPSVVMEDGGETDLGGHEETSSPEPYFCRPMLPPEVVDAVTCPSGNFRSAKGIFARDGSTTYYPPRGDLFDVLAQPCSPRVNYLGGSCDAGDSPQFGVLDDVDAVAAATPEPDALYSDVWTVPDALPPADYAVMVEVGKEFDTNASYDFASTDDPADPSPYAGDVYGLRDNVGQPSVVYRVPLMLSVGTEATTTDSVGHGDPLGADGTLTPADGTLASTPGSGEGRLALVDGPGGSGRFHVQIESCAAPACAGAGSPRPVEAAVPVATVRATSAVVEVQQQPSGSVLRYDLRYREITVNGPVNLAETARWVPGPKVPLGNVGDVSRVTLTDLAPDADYAVAVSALGPCGPSAPTIVRFATPKMKYLQLSGCFIASAAFDDDSVEILRWARDHVTRSSALAEVAAQLYYRSSPPLAEIVRGSELVRALVRRALRPAVTVARMTMRQRDALRSSTSNFTTTRSAARSAPNINVGGSMP